MKHLWHYFLSALAVALSSLAFLLSGSLSAYATTIYPLLNIDNVNHGNLTLTKWDVTGGSCSADVGYPCFYGNPISAFIGYTVGGSGGQVAEAIFAGLPGDSSGQILSNGGTWVTGGGHIPTFNGVEGAVPTSTVITIAAVHVADEAAFYTFITTAASAPTDYAYKTYLIDMTSTSVTSCEGSGCADYTPSYDWIHPTQPLGTRVEDNTLNFSGRYNISTSTANFLLPTDDLPYGFTLWIKTILLQQQADGSWKDLQMGVRATEQNTGTWNYSAFNWPGFSVFEPDGEYSYTMEFCYKPNVNGAGVDNSFTCTAPNFENINFQIDHNTWLENTTGLSATSTNGWFVDAASAIATALFSPHVQVIDLWKGALKNVTSTPPLTYAFQTEYALQNSLTENSAFALNLPGMTYITSSTRTYTGSNLNLSTAWTANAGQYLSNQQQTDFYNFLGYFYDVTYAIFIICGGIYILT